MGALHALPSVSDVDRPTYDAERKSGGFTILPDAIRRFAAARKDPFITQVYVTLTAHANRNGICWPSQPRIASESGISERKVRHIIAILVESGIIKADRKSHATVYTIVPSDQLPGIIEVSDRHVVPPPVIDETSDRHDIPPHDRHVVPNDRQDMPVKVARGAGKLDTRTKDNNQKNDDARGRRFSEDDVLTDAYRLAAISVDFPLRLVPAEFAEFKDYWISASGQNAIKRDWVATWRNHLRRQFARQHITPARDQNIADAERLAATGTTPAHWSIPDL